MRRESDPLMCFKTKQGPMLRLIAHLPQLTRAPPKDAYPPKSLENRTFSTLLLRASLAPLKRDAAKEASGALLLPRPSAQCPSKG